MTRDPRFTRQVRLAEVGEKGQARLAAAVVRVVSTGNAGEVETRYLVGAGVGVITRRAPGDVVAAGPAWIEELHPAARDVASGSYAALAGIRSVLAEDPG